MCPFIPSDDVVARSGHAVKALEVEHGLTWDREAAVLGCIGLKTLSWPPCKPSSVGAQMDGLAFSVGGYAVSAAYSAVADTIVYLPRIRKNSKQPDCAFEDFRHKCAPCALLG